MRRIFLLGRWSRHTFPLFLSLSITNNLDHNIKQAWAGSEGRLPQGPLDSGMTYGEVPVLPRPQVPPGDPSRSPLSRERARTGAAPRQSPFRQEPLLQPHHTQSLPANHPRRVGTRLSPDSGPSTAQQVQGRQLGQASNTQILTTWRSQHPASSQYPCTVRGRKTQSACKETEGSCFSRLTNVPSRASNTGDTNAESRSPGKETTTSKRETEAERSPAEMSEATIWATQQVRTVVVKAWEVSHLYPVLLRPPHPQKELNA